MTLRLVEFLRARLAEDLDAAVRAVPGPWQVDPDDPERVLDASGESVCATTQWGNRAAARHIARHDPARVLVQVGAMRRIVDMHERDLRDGEIEGSVLRLLALPYAGHPDYRREWMDHTGA